MSIVSAYQSKDKGNKPTTVRASLIRPADATAYTAGDIIAPDDPEYTGLVFKKAFTEPGSAYLYYIQMQVFSDQVTKLDADLLLFDTPLNSFFVDNTALATETTITKLEWQGYIGKISFAGANADVSYGHCIYEKDPSKIISSGSDDLYGLLIAQNGYTPVSSEEITLKMSILPRSIL